MRTNGQITMQAYISGNGRQCSLMQSKFGIKNRLYSNQNQRKYAVIVMSLIIWPLTFSGVAYQNTVSVPGTRQFYSALVCIEESDAMRPPITNVIFLVPTLQSISVFILLLLFTMEFLLFNSNSPDKILSKKVRIVGTSVICFFGQLSCILRREEETSGTQTDS